MRKIERKRRRGVILVWTAVGSLVFIGLVGLAVDMAHIYNAGAQLQAAADAAALTAVRYVRVDVEQAREEAIAIAAQNLLLGDPVVIEDNPDNELDGDIIVGRYNRKTGEFTPQLNSPNAVRIRVRRTEDSADGGLPLFFGSIFGVPRANIVRTTIAMSGGGTGAGMIGLGEGPCVLQMNGNVTLVVADGGIHLNTGPGYCAACTSGNTYTIDSDEITTAGGDVGTNNQCSEDYDGDIDTTKDVMPDPLAWLPEPGTGGMPVISNHISIQNAQSNPGTLYPGYYQQGISISGNTSNVVTFAPGIYVIGKQSSGGGPTPAGLSFTGGTIIANGVMFFILDGAVNFTAGAKITLSPLDEGWGDYEYMSIFQARSNTYEASIGGGPDLGITGTLYFPNNVLSLVGTGEGEFGNQIIAQKYNLSGNGNITINYTGNEDAVGKKPFLVR